MSYTNYKGRCVGRLMAFLYTYSHQADRWIFNGTTQGVFLDGKCTMPVATYTWDSDVEGDPNFDVPTFKFSPEFVWMEEQQKNLKAEVIERSNIHSKMFAPKEPPRGKTVMPKPPVNINRDEVMRKLKEQLFEHTENLNGVSLEKGTIEYGGVMIQIDPRYYAKLTLTIYEYEGGDDDQAGR